MTLAPTGQNLEEGLQGHEKKIPGCFCSQIAFSVEGRGAKNMLRDIYRQFLVSTFGEQSAGVSLGKGSKVREFIKV